MSTIGQRAALCEKFGWTWDYVNNEIPFNTLLKIMADSPIIEDIKDDDIELQEMNYTDLIHQINQQVLNNKK